MDRHPGNEPVIEPHHADLHAASGRAEQRSILTEVGRTSEVLDNRFGKPEGFRFFWKPLALTLGAGLPGLLLVLLAIFLPTLMDMAGLALSSAGGMTGLARLGIAFAGLFLLMLALPVYKPDDWTPEKQLELDRERQRYHEKKFEGKG
ncbi:hypothetical protein KDL44_15255 [bacterium]|nr:hypothetical protein [bacterium]